VRQVQMFLICCGEYLVRKRVPTMRSAASGLNEFQELLIRASQDAQR
jgi:hypothetical protein